MKKDIIYNSVFQLTFYNLTLLLIFKILQFSIFPNINVKLKLLSIRHRRRVCQRSKWYDDLIRYAGRK